MDSYPFLPSARCSHRQESPRERDWPHARVCAELVGALSGSVDYDVLRAISEGDFLMVMVELRRLRDAIDRAERLLPAIADTLH